MELQSFQPSPVIISCNCEEEVEIYSEMVRENHLILKEKRGYVNQFQLDNLAWTLSNNHTPCNTYLDCHQKLSVVHCLVIHQRCTPSFSFIAKAIHVYLLHTECT